VESLIRKYRQKGLLIDANLLLGFLIGSLHPRHLTDCRATTKFFGPADFTLLERFLGQFKRVVTTPHVLTEVSNLAGRLPSSLHTEFRLLFRAVIERLEEQLKPSRIVSAEIDFLRFGLTDTAISMVAAGQYLVLTDDVALAGLLAKRKIDVVNFNRIRVSAWALGLG
jgi:rRNA-processing protein FCF1